MTFSERLKEARKRLGLTQAECAELLGVSKRTIEMWESGRPPLAVAQEGAIARMSNAASQLSPELAMTAATDS